MQYGFFDDEKKEYVIDRPNTPLSWSNYLGSTVYGAIITNNAGGYSFYKSAANGRFMRFRTNSIPMDQPGRYIYIRDMESQDYWSNAWQPVAKPLEKYKSVCRHGTAYTVIESDYDSIHSETTYFVPLGKNYEYWLGKITNNDTRKRTLRLFTFVEYANHWSLYQDTVNLQYSQYILKMDVVDNIIDHGFNVNLPYNDDNFEQDGSSKHSFLGVAGANITGYETDRHSFLGPYRSYHNPLVVEKGQCSNSLAVADNGCGVIQFEIELAPGESKEFVVVMGVGKAADTGKQALKEASDLALVKNKYTELVNYWHKRLQGMSAKTPHAAFNSMFNMWNPYNCMMTYSWSRAASLIYAGERDGLGYRDTVQDILGVLHLIPEEAIHRLELMITGQVSTGGAMPVVKAFSHKPGDTPAPEESEYRSDDCLWLFNTIPAYVKETGNMDFYSKVLPYSDKGSGTVLAHMRKALEFNLTRSGAHGLPCGLAADWNDCLVLGLKGESVFVAFQVRYGLKTYAEIAEMLGHKTESEWALKQLEALDANIEKYVWDGEWYLRAFRHDGLKYGAKGDEEGSIWLNAQSWAVLSGHAQGERASKLLNVVNERLATEYGLMICDPPYTKADLNVVKAKLFNPGMKENGAIFCHTQGWAIMAETLTGNGSRAFRCYESYLPASYNEKAEIRGIEPYVYSQSTHSKYSPRFGASRLPWLTGAAAWAYFTASQYILGIQPDYQGLRIDPCIPKDWDKVQISRRFRGKTVNIEMLNPNKKEKGVEKLVVNGTEVKGNFIPLEILKETNTVVVYL
jgi:N,N'-diacetylchitobiose phosphorylase